MIAIYIISIVIGFLFPITFRKIDSVYNFEKRLRIYSSHRMKLPIKVWILYLMLMAVPVVNTCADIAFCVVALMFRFVEKDTDFIILGMTANTEYKKQMGRKSHSYKIANKICNFLNTKI